MISAPYSLASMRTIFVILMFVLVVFFTFRRPIAGLISFLFISSALPYLYNFNPYIFDALHLVRTAATLTLVSLLIHILLKKVSFYAPLQNWLMVGILCLMYLSRLSLGQSLDTNGISEFYKMVLVYFIITSIVDSKKRLRYAIWAIIIGMTITSWQAFNNVRTGETRMAVPMWWFDKNDFAVTLVMAVSLVMTFALSEKQWHKKIFLVGILFLFLLTITRTDSRGGYLGMAVVLLFFLFRLVKKREWRLAIIFFIPFILFILAWKTPEKFWQKVDTIGAYEEDQSATNRIVFWKAGLNMMKEKPLLGVGNGNFGVNLPYFMSVSTFSDIEYQNELILKKQRRSPHNMFILIGSENGVPALLLLLILIFKSYMDIRFATKKANEMENGGEISDMAFALKAGLAGWFVCGMFISPIYIVMPHALLALAAASRNVANREKKLVESRSVSS